MHGPATSTTGQGADKTKLAARGRMPLSMIDERGRYHHASKGGVAQEGAIRASTSNDAARGERGSKMSKLLADL